ncbi:MAG: CheR family methyltransferase [Methanoculleaceae archaeon]
MIDIGRIEYEKLLETIQQILKIQCTNYKEGYIKRRLASRMNSRKISSYRKYREFLLSNAEEQERLRNALTINVTKFFRDPEVYEYLRTEILPPLLKKKKRLRLWSAGCSSGEEPYSLAIMLHDMTGLRKDIDWMIYATDIDLEILKVAKEGIYERKTLEFVSDSQIRRHFIARKDGRYEIKPHIREKVRFRYHDLMSGRPAARFLDIVSCRNVTIYFTDAQKNEIARVIHEGLLPGGYYVMGRSEFLSRELDGLFIPVNPIHKVFQKAQVR